MNNITQHQGDYVSSVIISSPTIRIHKSWRTAFLVLCIAIKVLILYCGYLMAKSEMLQQQITISATTR